MNIEFINAVKEGALRAQEKYGICASLTIAQAILESGWGKKTIGNNLFGIKWSTGCGYDKIFVTTKEWVNGQYITTKEWFRKYESWNDSIYDHAEFLVKNNRYNNLLGIKDYKAACSRIQTDGYATDPHYADLLIQIIEENRLYEFDRTESGGEEVKIEIPDGSNIIPFMNGYIEMLIEQQRVIFHKDKFNYISFIRNKDESIRVDVYGKDQPSKGVIWKEPSEVPKPSATLFPFFGAYMELLQDRVIFHKNKYEYVSFTNERTNKLVYVDVYGKGQDGRRVIWKALN